MGARGWWGLWFVLATACAVVLVRGVLLVGGGERALLDGGGQVFGPGWHWVVPWRSVQRIDMRLQAVAFPGEALVSADHQALAVDYFLCWRVHDPLRFEAAGASADAVAQRLHAIVRERLVKIAAGLTLAQWLQPAADPLATTLEAVRAEGARLGVEVIDMQLQRLDVGPVSANAIYGRIEAALSEQARALRESGEHAAQQTRAQADAQAADVDANGAREAQRIRGEADARAAASYAKAYSRNRDFAAFYRAMQAYRSSLGREGDILVVTPEGEFFKYLHNGGTQAPATR